MSLSWDLSAFSHELVIWREDHRDGFILTSGLDAYQEDLSPLMLPLMPSSGRARQGPLLDGDSLLPLPTLHPLERSHPTRPTHKGGVPQPLHEGRGTASSCLKLFRMDLSGPHFLCNCGL